MIQIMLKIKKIYLDYNHIKWNIKKKLIIILDPKQRDLKQRDLK